MPTFTKAAIKATFISLLNKKPLNKITVKEIVEECGINRNSFYYHFDDIPSLLEEILVEEADRFVATETDNSTSVYESLISVIDYASSNKLVIQHIYNSANRTTFMVGHNAGHFVFPGVGGGLFRRDGHEAVQTVGRFRL